MKVTIESRNRAILDAPQTLATTKLGRYLEGASYWLKTGGMSFVPSGSNLELLERSIGNLEITGREELETPKLDLGVPIYSKTEPFAHQKRALEFISKLMFSALFMEQGTGKTKVCIDYASYLFKHGYIDAVIVVAPKGVHRQWVDEQFPTHCGIWYRATFWNNRIESTELLSVRKLHVYSFNYESLSSTACEIMLRSIFKRFSKVYVIYDESHRMKDVSTRTWEKCKNLADMARYRTLCTGTPIAKNLEDEWAQLKVLDEDILGIRYQSHFRNEFCQMGGYMGRQVVGAKNLERFRKKTAGACFRVTKEELGIEEKVNERWHFDLLPIQKKKIQELKREGLTEIERIQEHINQFNEPTLKVKVKIVLELLQKIQQVSNGFINVKHELPGNQFQTESVELMEPKENPRLQAMLEYVKALNGRQFIIWCAYRKDISLVVETLKRAGIDCSLYHGGIGKERREVEKENWLSGKTQGFVSNTATGGTGLNLHVGGCLDMLFYSNTEHSINRWQAEARIHRLGVKGIVRVTDLICRGSRDYPILHNLSSKKDLADLTLDDIQSELLGEFEQ